MDFIDKIRQLSSHIPKQLEFIKTEEATKTALVMPFINALGFNVFDPSEVTPELVADVGTKKGEKVDYAIFVEGKPVILFECKPSSCNLDECHMSQLYRYFSVTAAKFGILTNGIVYRFFTDTEEQNKMDPKPFFEFNMLNINEPLVEELKKFTKSQFNLEESFNTAIDLKYTKEVKRIFMEQLANPSTEFVNLFSKQIYSGRMTQNVQIKFIDIVKRALNQFINERISERLKNALEQDDRRAPRGSKVAEETEQRKDKEADTITTEEEIDAYYVIRSILREVTDVKRIAMRDAQRYCAILLDENNRKPLARLYFNSQNKQIALFNENRQEKKYALEVVDDIYKYAAQLKDTVVMYDSLKTAPPVPKSEETGQVVGQVPVMVPATADKV